MEIGTVRQIDIDHEMQGAYLDYAMSVIISRALPDVRDGLKPVQRRILYAMHDMGLRPDTAYKKSAGIVGEVLGKYHPHSDDAVYEAMARLAQDFSMRYVLVDGQGNFGSIDGDSPAAMRYTEARLAPIAMELLADIEKETVDFVPNYDDSRTEPTVLPAALPNLLVSGASGIAVGMATNIPPHNLGEVCDALVYVIDHYDKAEEITVEDLTEFVQGPDFPTGGVVYRYAGEDGNGDRVDLIRNAYALGRGRLTVQARVHIEEMSRNRSRIVVTELPYQVNKSRLIERIAELVRDGRIEGITDLRDESDRQGMRISIELTRTVEPRGVLSQLFTLTPMQTTFSLRILALVNGEPRLLSLKRVLLHYLEHRQEIITRRSRYLLERAQLRAHVLEGLLKALDNIDEVIDIIRRSQTPDTARVNLMKRLGLTEIQAQAILDMPLKRLAALERRKIADEYKEKLQEIKYLQSLLRSPAKIRGVIREELMALREKFGDSRRTRIVAQEKGHHTARDLVEAADVLLTLAADGQVSRTSQAPGPNQSVPLAQARGDTRDDAVFFTASGQAVVVPLHQIPSEQPTPIGTLVGFDRTETVIGLLVVPHPAGDKEVPETFLTLATRGGRIKRIMLKDLVSAGGRGAVTVIAVEENDQLGWVIETAGQDELLLATRQGKAIRFSEVEVRPMGLPAAGVLAVKLGEQDAVVGGGVAQDNGYLVLFTEKGFAKRTAVKNFPTQKRYGGGVQATSLSARTGPVAAAAVAAEGQILVLIAAKRAALALPMEAIPHLARTSAGQSRRKDTNLPFLDLANDGQPVLLTALAAGGSTPAAPVHPSAEPKKPAPRSQKTAKVAAPEPAKGSGSTPKKTTGSKKVTQLELDQADSPSPKNTGKTSKSPKAGAKKPSPRRRGGSPSGENPKGRSAQDGSTEAAPQQEMVPTAKNRSQKQR